MQSEIVAAEFIECLQLDRFGTNIPPYNSGKVIFSRILLDGITRYLDGKVFLPAIRRERCVNDFIFKKQVQSFSSKAGNVYPIYL